ncbi:MAG: hypothetical protein ABW278_03635 [Steroidobacteraceae bacterium]
MRHAVLAALAAIVSTPALAVGQLADVTVIDRDSGQKLQAYFHRGEYWVAGPPGAHYAVQVRSHSGVRLLAVTSVDGVNVLTGETAAVGQRGYVFGPWEGYDIAGWRKSDAKIAAFSFTSIPESYAARTGRPGNVGVIGVALFRELRPQVVEQESAVPEPAMPPLATLQVPRAPPAGGAQREERAADSAKAQQSLGTGHGRSEYSRVYQVAFERAQSAPDEVVRIRYDSRDNLVAMGVIRAAPPRPRPLDPFPGSQLGYVPDP